MPHEGGEVFVQVRELFLPPGRRTTSRWIMVGRGLAAAYAVCNCAEVLVASG